jgi:hypothetical protein
MIKIGTTEFASNTASAYLSTILAMRVVLSMGAIPNTRKLSANRRRITPGLCYRQSQVHLGGASRTSIKTSST